MQAFLLSRHRAPASRLLHSFLLYLRHTAPWLHGCHLLRGFPKTSCHTLLLQFLWSSPSKMVLFGRLSAQISALHPMGQGSCLAHCRAERFTRSRARSGAPGRKMHVEEAAFALGPEGQGSRPSKSRQMELEGGCLWIPGCRGAPRLRSSSVGMRTTTVVVRMQRDSSHRTAPRMRTRQATQAPGWASRCRLQLLSPLDAVLPPRASDQAAARARPQNTQVLVNPS